MSTPRCLERFFSYDGRLYIFKSVPFGRGRSTWWFDNLFERGLAHMSSVMGMILLSYMDYLLLSLLLRG